MMSTTSQYAVRALALLSREGAGATLLGRELAEASGIPANYLSKVLWQLRNAGLVSATRGSGGGYRLEKPPEQIRLLDVAEVFDHVRARRSCLMGSGECNESQPCAAHGAWKRVRDAYLEFLEVTTLATVSGTATTALAHLPLESANKEADPS